MRACRTPFLSLLLICLLLCPGRATSERPRSIIGILGAKDIEVSMLRQRIRNKEIHRIFGIEFSTGTLEGRRVVVAATGEGMVNATMTTTLLIDHFGPRQVIFTGIAGGLNPDLKPGDVVIGTMTVQDNLETVSNKGKRMFRIQDSATGKYVPTFFQATSYLLKLANEAAGRITFPKIRTSEGERKPKVVEGIIATGNSFIASEARRRALRRRFKADVVEMEGAAVAQVCYLQNIPCIVIRCLRDDADQLAPSAFKHFITIAAQNPQLIVLEMLKLM